MTGPEYRRRCQALGYSTRVLAQILGVSRRTLAVRWKSLHIRTEALLALESLEHRRTIYRTDFVLQNTGRGKELAEVGAPQMSMDFRELRRGSEQEGTEGTE